MILAQIGGDLKFTKVELYKPKLDKEYDFILRYSSIINTRLLKLLSSTSSVKGQFFKMTLVGHNLQTRAFKSSAF